MLKVFKYIKQTFDMLRKNEKELSKRKEEFQKEWNKWGAKNK